MPSKFSPRLGLRGVLGSKRGKENDAVWRVLMAMTRPLAFRVLLTFFAGNKNYFKGYNSRIEGTHSTKGAYFIREERVMRILAPDLTGFNVRTLGTGYALLVLELICIFPAVETLRA
jgi:hypothetical protein